MPKALATAALVPLTVSELRWAEGALTERWLLRSHDVTAAADAAVGSKRAWYCAAVR